MKIFVMSGEVSGEQHAARLVEELLNQNPDLEISFCGGATMEQVTQKKSIIPLERLAIMGFLKVLLNLRSIRLNFSDVFQHLNQIKPDALILVDYPGFNLRLAKWAFRNHIPVFYYISPTVWAWKEKRYLKIKHWVQQLYCILPFEKEFYAARNVSVSYFGNPTAAKWMNLESLPRTQEIALLAGSRMQELEILLPIFSSLMSEYPNKSWVVSQAPGISSEIYHQFLGNQNTYRLEKDTQNLLRTAQVSIVCSGTASLEAGLANCPQVLVYRTDRFSFWLAQKLVQVKHISLVNLVLGGDFVTELVGPHWGTKEIYQAILKLEKKPNKHQFKEELLNKFGRSYPEKQIATDLLNRLSK